MKLNEIPNCSGEEGRLDIPLVGKWLYAKNKVTSTSVQGDIRETDSS